MITISLPSSPAPEENVTPDSYPSVDVSTHGVGLSNPQLSQGRRMMLDLVNRLHSTGIQVDIDLPQIAVIGSQSAGKSSLIESISGITLPRAAGTCTRCPTECRLSRTSEPWKCVVALRFTTDSRGQTLGQAVNELFGPTIFDKSQVEERIRRAQRAILNPSTARKRYLDGEEEDGAESELSFSINCVSLQISGPDVADLSFCDLPGLIASVGRGGNTNDVNLVQSLVTAYISKPSCVILLTVACETDFENQGAHGLAKKHDPGGKRTIGVLTKPDRIPAGEESNWLPFIRNEKETLENNWYCVKQPNSHDLKQGVSWAQARTREDEFFSMTVPWSELDPMYQKYLRTSNLVDRLSSILSDLISKRLPQIQEELEKAIYKTEEGLQALPKEPSRDPRGDIATMLHVFTVDVSRHVEGVPDEDGLIQMVRPMLETFRRAIRDTAPNFRPYERRYAGLRKLPKAQFLSHEEADEDITHDEYDEVEESRAQEEADPQEAVELTRIPPPNRQGKGTVGCIYVDDVFARAARARTRELPGNYPFVVQKAYITSVIEQWRNPAYILCRAVFGMINEHVRKLVHQHFESFGQGGLEQRVKVLLQDHVKRCMERTMERIDWLLALEDQPFTLNDHYLADYKSKFLSYYKGARQKDQNQALLRTIENFGRSSAPRPLHAGLVGESVSETRNPPPTGIAKVLTGLAEIGMIGIKPEDVPKLLPQDAMEPALIIMADVRAYFQVAYKRFADNVPLAIDYDLIRGVERDILSTLNAGLGINGPDGQRICKELSQESPHNAGRREELSKKLERLSIASQELLHIGF